MKKITPKQLGYIMPAEWEEHAAVWLVWPTDDITFINRLDKAREDVAKIIKALEPSERVELLVLNRELKQAAQALLKKYQVNLSKVNFHLTNYVDIWIRDYGPIFIVKRSKTGAASAKLAMVDCKYDAYGKGAEWYFVPLVEDDRIPEWMNGFLKLPRFESKTVLEGGAIDVNGRGMCLTTEQCLLDAKRNPGITKTKMEKFLNQYLGIEKTIWLKQGLTNDHTDGHVDDIARFVSPNTIVGAFEPDRQDENYHLLKKNYEILRQAADQGGKPFKIIKLPMPHMKYTETEKIKYETGDKAPVSYCNFYIGNTVVLVPTFKDINDNQALNILQAQFPERQIIGIDCRDLIYGGGTIHCLSREQPAA